MTLRSPSLAILGCALAIGSVPAWPLGLGSVPQSVPLGQALDLRVPLRLDAGQALTPSCVRAEVQLGTRRVPDALLDVSLEPPSAAGESMLRLRSMRVVDEPVVAVTLRLGCAAEVSRQFTVLADPAIAAAALATSGRRDPVRLPQPRAAAAPGGAAAAAPSSRRATAAAASATALAERPAEPLRALDPGAAPAAPVWPDPQQRTPAWTGLAAVAAGAAGPADPMADAAGSPLQPMATAPQATGEDAASQRGAAEQLRSRLNGSQSFAALPTTLFAGLLATMLLGLGLAWRLRALRQPRRGLLVPRPPADAATTPQPAGQPPSNALQRLAPRPQPPPPQAVPMAHDAAAAAPMDELIDLMQQVEFFEVLGDDQALAERLLSQLNTSAPTTGPLPYLQLLELLGRRGDREACERLRARFGECFDGRAAPVPANARGTGELQDFPDVLARLQQAWREPHAALAALQRLLLAAPGEPLLPLPAYRDALALYLVARDHAPRTDRPDDAQAVDLLLPLVLPGDDVTSIFDRLDEQGVGAPAGATGAIGDTAGVTDRANARSR